MYCRFNLLKSSRAGETKGVEEGTFAPHPHIFRPSTGSVKSEQATRARIKKIALDGDLLS